MSAGSGRHDDRLKGYLVFGVGLMVLLAWVVSVKLIYTIPPERAGAAWWHALLATAHEPKLWVLPIIAALSGFSMMVVINAYYRTWFGGAAYDYKLRGPDMVSQQELVDITTESGQQLQIGGIPIPCRAENEHLSVVGSTGSGKTQAIASYIASAQARGDRMIVVDPNGGFMEHFFQDGDMILNPFDARGQPWSIFNEIKTAYDVTQFAVSVIPRAPSTEQEAWNSMARTIVSEVMLKLRRTSRGTTRELSNWLTIASNDELQEMLADTSAAGMFHGADETLGSVRSVLTQYITPHKFLSDCETGEMPFSIRDWLTNGSGNLWITWREDMLQSLKPLISCWVDTVCAASLSTPSDDTYLMHLVVDELDSLNKLNYMLPACTKGRKHGFRVLVGIQSYAQLNHNYGIEDAMTLRNSFRNTYSLAIAEMDTLTAEQISLGLGEHEVVRNKKSLSIGGVGVGPRGSISAEAKNERMVFPSEIHTLPNLTGYLKFSGDIPFARVTMRYKARPHIIDPLIMIDSIWTAPFDAQPAGFLGGSDVVI